MVIPVKIERGVFHAFINGWQALCFYDKWPDAIFMECTLPRVIRAKFAVAADEELCFMRV